MDATGAQWLQPRPTDQGDHYNPGEHWLATIVKDHCQAIGANDLDLVGSSNLSDRHHSGGGREDERSVEDEPWDKRHCRSLGHYDHSRQTEDRRQRTGVDHIRAETASQLQLGPRNYKEK